MSSISVMAAEQELRCILVDATRVPWTFFGQPGRLKNFADAMVWLGMAGRMADHLTTRSCTWNCVGNTLEVMLAPGCRSDDDGVAVQPETFFVELP